MIIREQMKQTIASLPEGKVITASYFDVPRQYRATVVKALNQFEYNGTLKRMSKGHYYKPIQSMFGMDLRPMEEEIVKDFLVQDGRTVGYITGTRAFASMGLTTQISSAIVIGTNVSRRPICRGDCEISFVLQPNPIVAEDIPLFRYLDALKFVKEVPASTPSETVEGVRAWVEYVSKRVKKRFFKLAFAYQPYVRAQVGAIFESLGLPAEELQKTLNPVSRYKLCINAESLPTIKNWNII